MIKVLNIISDSNIGGAGKCVLNFLKYYDRKKFSVKVIVPRGSLLKPEIEKLKTDVIEADGITDKSFDIKAVKSLKKIIKRLNPDIVHTHGTLSGRIAAKLCGKKIIYTRHSVFPVSESISRGVGKSVNKAVNEFFSDRIIAVAEAAKKNLTDSGINPDRIDVILNGVEPLTSVSDDIVQELRKEYRISQNDFVVGILARLEPYKGHIYLIEAAEMLKAKNIPIKVIIAGTGSCEEELKKLISEKGLEDTVIMAGFVTNIAGLLSIMDIQANASFGTEATSLSLLEGMSLGIPAVVSDFGGNPGVIADGVNGFVFPQKNSTKLALFIKELYEDTNLYSLMSRRSKEIFNEKFTAEIYARNIENEYESVFEGGRKSGK
ncbi:glycosyltransferase family 4 protein [Lachnospiraceae bacterium NSJ-143]|nr:glycosyltransferase family 4 protein [Lachnospiraceae bacterium NSJ-143]